MFKRICLVVFDSLGIGNAKTIKVIDITALHWASLVAQMVKNPLAMQKT